MNLKRMVHVFFSFFVSDVSEFWRRPTSRKPLSCLFLPKVLIA